MLHLRYLLSAVLPALLLSGLASSSQAQPVSTSGTLVVVPATGELTAANDQAHATLMLEEQDQDKAAAASRVNQKMKQGIAIIKREDPQAVLKTRGYFTYAVYAEPNPAAPNKSPAITGWRVGQYLDVTSTNLGALPKTIAAAQSLLTLNGLEFGLSRASSKKLDDALIAATYDNLKQRIAAIAYAMARAPADASVETLDFEGSGNYAAAPVAAPRAMMQTLAKTQESVAEPSFEPGESTVAMRMVGKVRFK